MAEDRLTKKEWEALQAKGGDPVYSEEVQAAIRTGEIKESDLTDEAIQLINQGRLKDAQGVIARNQEKTDLKRDIDFTKNDVYIAGMAANTTNKTNAPIIPFLISFSQLILKPLWSHNVLV